MDVSLPGALLVFGNGVRIDDEARCRAAATMYRTVQTIVRKQGGRSFYVEAKARPRRVAPGECPMTRL